MQLTTFLIFLNILSDVQSCFQFDYVLNIITSTLHSKQYYAAIFIDLPKAFDFIDHSTFAGRLVDKFLVTVWYNT